MISRLLSTQRLAVLASYGDDQPYTSLVAFAASDDLRAIHFAISEVTTMIHTGDIVTVDGYLGIVTVRRRADSGHHRT